MISGSGKNKGISEVLKSNENGDTAYPNLQDTMKAVLGEKFIAQSTTIKRKKNQRHKLESSQTCNLRVYLKALEKRRSKHNKED